MEIRWRISFICRLEALAVLSNVCMILNPDSIACVSWLTARESRYTHDYDLRNLSARERIESIYYILLTRAPSYWVLYRLTNAFGEWVGKLGAMKAMSSNFPSTTLSLPCVARPYLKFHVNLENGPDVGTERGRCDAGSPSPRSLVVSSRRIYLPYLDV